MENRLRTAPSSLSLEPTDTAQPPASSGSLLPVLRRAWSAPRSPQAIVLVLAAWIVLVANLTLWRNVLAIESGPRGVFISLGVAVLLFAAVATLFALTAWSRWMKPLWLFLLFAAGVSQHYMLNFGAVIDSTMMANVLDTNAREAADLLTWGLLGNIFLVAGLPALWLVPLPVKRFPPLRTVLRVAVLVGGSMLVAVAATAAMYSVLAPLVRNNMGLRYLPNPIVPVWSTARVATRPLWNRPCRARRTCRAPTRACWCRTTRRCESSARRAPPARAWCHADSRSCRSDPHARFRPPPAAPAVAWPTPPRGWRRAPRRR